jgi:hypothetical protein
LNSYIHHGVAPSCRFGAGESRRTVGVGLDSAPRLPRFFFNFFLKELAARRGDGAHRRAGLVGVEDPAVHERRVGGAPDALEFERASSGGTYYYYYYYYYYYFS